MDMQKLFDLIARVADNSSALSVPHHSEIINVVKGWDGAEDFYACKDVEASIDALRDSTYSTMSERRSMTKLLVRSIIEVICERQGLDLICRFPNIENTLHVGVVVRDTHTGSDAVYGIRDCDPYGPFEPVWEYLQLDHSRLLDAIAWRLRSLHGSSIYGWADPSNINKPLVI